LSIAITPAAADQYRTKHEDDASIRGKSVDFVPILFSRLDGIDRFDVGAPDSP